MTEFELAEPVAEADIRSRTAADRWWTWCRSATSRRHSVGRVGGIATDGPATSGDYTFEVLQRVRRPGVGTYVTGVVDEVRFDQGTQCVIGSEQMG